VHSQSQTIQEPLSAELTPVRLHPTVQLPVGERKRQVAAALAGQKAGPTYPGVLQVNRGRRWESCPESLDSLYGPLWLWTAASIPRLVQGKE
jgi:hypothetical protein